MDLTLLHFSIARKYKEMIALLLEYGADIHLKTRSNKTSLMHAVEANNPELVELFLAKGANPNDRDIYGEPVMFYIIINVNAYESIYHKSELDSQEEKLKIMKRLYNAEANVNANFQPIDSYLLLIYYAIIHGHRGIVNFILFETDFNYQSLDHRAIKLSNLKPELLARDAQIDSESKEFFFNCNDFFTTEKRRQIFYGSWDQHLYILFMTSMRPQFFGLSRNNNFDRTRNLSPKKHLITRLDRKRPEKRVIFHGS